MYYISGDCHGEFGNIDFFCRYHRTDLSDVMVLLGDVGLNYFLDQSDRKKKQQLSGLQLTFFCIHGNHEVRPYNIATYIKKEWHGGIVYYEPEYPNLLFAKDGEIYDLDGKKAIVIGGAYSVDKNFRLQAGFPWFLDEQPSEETKTYVESRLKQCDWSVDYVFSHTCPKYMMPNDRSLEFIVQGRVDDSTEEWLERLSVKMHFEKWYFGHFHENRTCGNFEMLYEEIRELGSDEFLQRLGRPRYRQGQMAMFRYFDGIKEVDCYGRIEGVDSYGTMGQFREVSYDIYGPDYKNPDEKVLYKHIEESRVQSFSELKDGV